MAIIRWKPLPELEEFFDDIQHRWNGDFAADVYEDEHTIVVEMNTAGIDPHKIDIEVDDNHLRISGTREEKTKTENKNFYHKEIRRGSFERVISLPNRVMGEQTTAEFTNGILTVCLPKKANRPVEKIKVRTKSS